MIKRYQSNGLRWVDVVAPSHDEIRAVVEECRIPPSLTDDLSTPVPRSEVIKREDALKVTLDFPVVKRTDVEGAHEIKFLITEHNLITVRYEDITAVHKFGKEFEVLATLRKASSQTTGGHLFVSLMEALYNSLSAKLEYIDSRLSYIEKEIFNEREKEMVLEISKVSQRLITFKQSLYSHRDVLHEATPLFKEVFESDVVREIEDLRTHYHHLMRKIDALSNLLDELRNTNNALVSTKQNEIMKILTIMAFITFPLTLITSMFGMNTVTLPIVGQEGDFWMILSMMGAATIGFFVYFKYKRWI